MERYRSLRYINKHSYTEWTKIHCVILKKMRLNNIQLEFTLQDASKRELIIYCTKKISLFVKRSWFKIGLINPGSNKHYKYMI